MMIEVRNDVLSATQQKQRPWENSSLTSPFYFMPAVAVATTDTASPASSGNAGAAQTVDKEVVFWQSIQNSNSPAQFQAYLDQYPNGTFAALARTRIEEMKAKPADTARSSEQVASLTSPDTTVPAADEVERSIGLTKQGRSRVQLALTLLGYSTGGTDGVFGAKSRTAISAWQADQHETATGYLTAKQHAALLDAAAPKLAAWDAEQKRKFAEVQARQQQAAAEAAQQQQTSYDTTPTTIQPSTQDAEARKAAAAQAEAERLRQENARLKKQAETHQDRQNVELGVGLFNTVVGGAIPFVR
jgi:peptidoglycan hydrolase-like protein with peptidoglycan-binding domain